MWPTTGRAGGDRLYRFTEVVRHKIEVVNKPHVVVFTDSDRREHAVNVSHVATADVFRGDDDQWYLEIYLLGPNAKQRRYRIGREDNANTILEALR